MKRNTRPGVVFSSEDSPDTDHSMVSSIDGKDGARDKPINQVTSIREQINKMFMAEPELLDHIKFEKFKEEDDDLPAPIKPKKEDPKRPEAQPNSRSQTPGQKKGTLLSLGNSDDSITDIDDKSKKLQLSSKYWDVINKEMVKTAKEKALPSIKRINHIVNIYKAKLDYKDNIPETTSHNTKPNLRFGSGQNGNGQKDKKQSNTAKPKGKDDNEKALNANPEFVDDSGVQVFSFKRRMQLSFKNRREKLSKEKNDLIPADKSPTLLNLEQQAPVKRSESKTGTAETPKPRIGSVETPKPRTSSIETPKADGLNQPTLNQFSTLSRHSTLRGTLKPGSTAMGVVERLTKSGAKKEEVVIIDGKEFKSFRARELYLEKQKATDLEHFKREAIKKIKQVRREFYDRVQNSKPVVPESIKFTKDKTSRLTNLLMPEFDKAVKFNEKEKESIFALDDRVADDRHNNVNDKEIIAKMSKLFNGNIQHVWKVYQHDVK